MLQPVVKTQCRQSHLFRWSLAPSSLAPEMLAQRRVDARLPARSGGAEPVDHVLVETQGNELLPGVERWPAAPAPNQYFAVMQIGFVEPLVSQLRRGIWI